MSKTGKEWLKDLNDSELEAKILNLPARNSLEGYYKALSETLNLCFDWGVCTKYDKSIKLAELYHKFYNLEIEAKKKPKITHKEFNHYN